MAFFHNHKPYIKKKIFFIITNFTLHRGFGKNAVLKKNFKNKKLNPDELYAKK